MHVKRHRGALLFALIACAGIGMATPVGREFAVQKGAFRDRAEMTLFPSGRFLSQASVGHRHLVADLAWVAAIQYYGKHRRTDRRYALAPHLFTVITDADPAFENAYLFGSLIMVEAGFVRQAASLLRKGTERNPSSWKLKFELGFFHYVVTRSWRLAGEAFAAAARDPRAPEYVHRFAAAAYERAGDAHTARKLWEMIARESENREIRRMAEEHLNAMGGEE